MPSCHLRVVLIQLVFKFPRLTSLVRFRMLVNFEYVTLTINKFCEYGTLLHCVPIMLDCFAFKTLPKECFAKRAAAREMDKKDECMGNKH